MKDLGKSQSTLRDINVVESFGNRDEEQNFTDKVMDKHLTDLESDNVGKTSICDIAQYMANLKEKHMESERLETTDVGQRNGSARKMEGDAEILDLTKSSSDSSKPSSEEETSLVIIDTKVDKIFKSDKPISKNEQTPKKHIKSPRSSISMSRSPDRNKSMSNSPVKIIKIKSPRNSVDSGKRLSVSLSRSNSKERSPDRHGSSSPRRSSDGGILKISMPNSKTDPLLQTTAVGGILKRNTSPGGKARSPDRSYVGRKSLSPGASFESRSPDRNRLSPHSSFDRRSPDRKSIDSRCSDTKFTLKSPRGSFESRSPERGERDRKRSLSAHSSFDKSKSPEPYYHYYNMSSPYAYQSPERKEKRQSKSLERSSSRDSNSSYRYGLSPERIYRIGPVRSHSAENTLKCDIDLGRSNDSLTRSIEYPTCVECLYQRKPSQQKSRGRQSRTRKKVPRGMPMAQMSSSLERTESIDKSDGCVDCHDYFEIHV